MAAAKMKKLFTVGKTTFYWAGSRFLFKGLWAWDGNANKRVLPINNFKQWNGKV